nr:MAG TPA: hypothetical protein [Caudoviricetes sp.]
MIGLVRLERKSRAGLRSPGISSFFAGTRLVGCAGI